MHALAEGGAHGSEVRSRGREVREERDAHVTRGGKLTSGRGGKAKSRKQTIAIGLSEARKKGAKVPRRS